MAVKDTYTNYQEIDYNVGHELFSKKTVLPSIVIDTDRFGIDHSDPEPRYYPPLTGVRSVTLRYTPHQTSNENQRDTLYYGQVAADIDLLVWGFETYQEFRDHLDPDDKYRAQEAWEELKCELAGTHAKCRFWVAKNDMAHTRPGFWAITVDRDHTRFALLWADNEYHLRTGLRYTKQNKIQI